MQDAPNLHINLTYRNKAKIMYLKQVLTARATSYIGSPVPKLIDTYINIEWDCYRVFGNGSFNKFWCPTHLWFNNFLGYMEFFDGMGEFVVVIGACVIFEVLLWYWEGFRNV